MSLEFSRPTPNDPLSTPCSSILRLVWLEIRSFIASVSTANAAVLFKRSQMILEIDSFDSRRFFPPVAPTKGSIRLTIGKRITVKFYGLRSTDLCSLFGVYRRIDVRDLSS